MSYVPDLAGILMPISGEDIANARKKFGLGENDVRRDCEVIEAWMKQQAHFPNDYDSVRIERFLLRNKFRVERTKEKLENYYTSKAINRELFKKMDTRCEGMKKLMSSIVFTPMPKLINGTERLFVLRFVGEGSEFSFEMNALLVFALLELELVHDYAVGMRLIVDYGGFTMAHFKTLSISLMAKIMELYQESLSGRFISIEYINGLSIMGILLDFLKIAVPEKLYKKINIHQNLDSLKASIPEEYLPSDYGGKQRSTDEIYVDVQNFLHQNRDYLLKRMSIMADESKRIGPVKKNEMFGVNGSFKKINLD